jgi:hypothetical protein
MIIPQTVAAIRQLSRENSSGVAGTAGRTQPFSERRCKYTAFPEKDAMADRNDASSSMISQGEAAGRVDNPPATGGERALNVVGEFMDAGRSAAESLLDEQKRRVAGLVSGIADALRSAARSLEESQNPAMAGYAHRAADQIRSFAGTVGERDWNELVAATEDFARRQPTTFVLAAVATGFVLGRFLWASTSAGHPADRRPSLRQPGSEGGAVTAAVSSGSRTGAAAGYGAGASGAVEAG